MFDWFSWFYFVCWLVLRVCFCRPQQRPLTAVVSTNTMTRCWSRTGRITCFSGASSGTQWGYKTASCTGTSWAACSKWESRHSWWYYTHSLIVFLQLRLHLKYLNFILKQTLPILLCICDVFCILHRNIDSLNNFNFQGTLDGKMT